MRVFLYKDGEAKLFEGKDAVKAAEKSGWLDSPAAKPKAAPKKKAAVKKVDK